MEEESKISMVDITEKPEILRMAKAEGEIKLRKETLKAIKAKQIKKGNVFAAAELASINAVKRASDMILLAHPIPITEVKVTLEIDEIRSTVKVSTIVRSFSRTGVEIEALMGVMVGLLTVFDMCKYLEKDKRGQYLTTDISNIKVVEKIKENMQIAKP